MVAEITITGTAPVTPPSTTTTPPPTTTTPPTPGTTVSGEAALTTPPTTGDKVFVKINNVSTTFTVGDSENTLTEVDEAVRTMKIGDKKNVTISSRTGGKITTNTFVVELVDIQRKNTVTSSQRAATFGVVSPAEVKANTPFDIKVTALDATGKILTDYNSTIFVDLALEPER